MTGPPERVSQDDNEVHVSDLTIQTVSPLRRVDATGVPLLIARLLLGGMFVVMGLNKVTDPVNFLKLIRQYNIASDAMPWLLNLTAVLVPWIEILIGVLLILGIAIRGSAVVAFLMLAFFTPIVIQRASEIQAAEQVAFCSVVFDCGCGAGEVNICFKIVENSVLTMLALVALFSSSRRWCLRPHLTGPSQTQRSN